MSYRVIDRDTVTTFPCENSGYYVAAPRTEDEIVRWVSGNGADARSSCLGGWCFPLDLDLEIRFAVEFDLGVDQFFQTISDVPEVLAVLDGHTKQFSKRNGTIHKLQVGDRFIYRNSVQKSKNEDWVVEDLVKNERIVLVFVDFQYQLVFKFKALSRHETRLEVSIFEPSHWTIGTKIRGDDLRLSRFELVCTCPFIQCIHLPCLICPCCSCMLPASPSDLRTTSSHYGHKSGQKLATLVGEYVTYNWNNHLLEVGNETITLEAVPVDECNVKCGNPCPNCTEIIPRDSKFCNHCGVVQNQSSLILP